MRIYDNGTYRDMTGSEIAEMSISKETKIAQLKQKLADTDYIACKIAEGAAVKEEYEALISKRQSWRDEINTLEEAAGNV